MELSVIYEVEFTDEFEWWWTQSLSEAEQDEVAAVVQAICATGGQTVRRPSSGVANGRKNLMAKSFKQLRNKMSPDRRAKIAAKTQVLLDDLPLQEIRLARKLSQQEVARRLNVNQAAVSKMEHRTDWYISTLRKHIEAMGGVLTLLAEFPEGQYLINDFGGLGDPESLSTTR